MTAEDFQLHGITRRDGFYAEFDRFLRGTVARFNRECRRTIPPDARDDLLEAGLVRLRKASDVAVRDLAYDLLDGASEGEYLRDRVYDYLEHFVGVELDRILDGGLSGVSDPSSIERPDVSDVEEELEEVEEVVLDEAWRALVRFGMDRLGMTPAPLGWKPEDGEPELPSQRKEVVTEGVLTPEGGIPEAERPDDLAERVLVRQYNRIIEIVQERMGVDESFDPMNLAGHVRDLLDGPQMEVGRPEPENDRVPVGYRKHLERLERMESGDSHSDQEDDVGDDAHDRFEQDQRHRLELILARALRDRRAYFDPSEQEPQRTGPIDAYIELTDPGSERLASEVVEELGVDFAWGLIGRCYADEGISEQFYQHFLKAARDMDHLMTGAHGNEAAEAIRLQVEMALRRFIVETGLPREPRDPAEVKEVEEPQEPERSRDPDSPESAAELGEAAVETAEKVADEHLSGRPGLEPLETVARTSCIHHPETEAVVQAEDSGQPLCRLCALLVSDSVETETVTELEGRYRACMADHPSVADVSCQRPAGHEGKHHAENGTMGHAWPQEKRYGHGPDEDVPPPGRVELLEGPCYDLDLDPDGILAEQLDSEVYRIRADHFRLTDEFYDFVLDGDRVGCFPRDAVLAVRKVQR